jgi:hypothetical protein
MISTFVQSHGNDWCEMSGSLLTSPRDNLLAKLLLFVLG